jgi:hypothetical protein
MMDYEVEFCTNGGHPFSTTHLVAEDDAQAIARARVLLRCGIGDFYVIRRDGKVVHVEWVSDLSPRASEASPRYWQRIHACVEQGLKTRNLQERRFLMLLASKFLGCTPVQAQMAARIYRVFLIGSDEAPVADTELEAENDAEAFDLASALAAACARKCVRFEVWRGQALKGTGARPFCSPAQLGEPSQRRVVAGEIALHESCTSIAESEELLQEVDKWVRRSLYDA